MTYEGISFEQANGSRDDAITFAHSRIGAWHRRQRRKLAPWVKIA